FAFIHTPDPTKVKVVERERHEGELRLLEPVATTIDTIFEEVVPLHPRRHMKRKTVVVDTGGPSHPPKKLREDYEAPGGPLSHIPCPLRQNYSHHSGANIEKAEVDSFSRPSVPIIRAATTVTLTSGPAAVI
ncbi:hypothetical protein Tco_0752743, partial [Tanacetum coccineum]